MTLEFVVEKESFSLYPRGASREFRPQTLRVKYWVGLEHVVSEWLCFDLPGWRREAAERWWRERSNVVVPLSTVEAAFKIIGGAICKTKAITIKIVPGEKYERVVGYELGEKPDWHEPGPKSGDRIDGGPAPDSGEGPAE